MNAFNHVAKFGFVYCVLSLVRDALHFPCGYVIFHLPCWLFLLTERLYIVHCIAGWPYKETVVHVDHVLTLCFQKITHHCSPIITLSMVNNFGGNIQFSAPVCH